MNIEDIINEIKLGTPFEGLPNIRIIPVEGQQTINQNTDINYLPIMVFTLFYNGNPIQINGEVKTQITPKTLLQLTPWLNRLKSNSPDQIYAVIGPYFSNESQKFCLENYIDFIDLSGNISIQIPGKLFIQRLGRPNKFKQPQLLRNPFGGASSRVLRVLLEFPNRRWTISDIAKELPSLIYKPIFDEQNKFVRWDEPAEWLNTKYRMNLKYQFQLSFSSISKTIQALEEEVLIIRDKMDILIPDKRRLLFRWAEKYQENYRRIRRKFIITKNPFGFDLPTTIKGLQQQFNNFEFLVTGTSGANLVAPYTSINQIEIFVLRGLPQAVGEIVNVNNKPGLGPDILLMPPYDIGVALFAQEQYGINFASSIQLFLDCFARGGRDMKQAEYLLTNIIEQQWNQR